ncbi:MAG: bifunctional UDP-3-O-[3-hydroxymyristoyl] N-acetylglucosamine deacetylase/3-hydroxyacyl-ACP dehydratase [Chitinispirillaceae bacterium]|nr:bifunctional UDP-3-O-[3-hydroxymyristoyl] N-acetylglucosamine deacetylase/3-hydroxyacyl-ACP dehydratase [Chitinispirillaceae bacterium]
MMNQHTIRKSFSLTGVGLHTGSTATVTLHPAPDNYGIRFIRSDIPDSPEIEADIDNVVDLSRGTAVGKNGVSVHSTEHCMSALAGLQIDNCKIEVDAPELPLMDGSSFPYVEAIQKLGLTEQRSEREYITIDEPLVYTDTKNDVALAMLPSHSLCVTVMIDYKHPALGAQHSTLFRIEDYAKDFAPARTFCFLSEIEKLREKGLIKGGSLSSAMVVQDVELTDDHIEYIRKLFNENGPIVKGENGFLNNVDLRYFNELCRHKVVDLMGDLYLLGKPVLGHIQAARTGHAANIEFARKIRAYVIEKKKKQTAAQLSYNDILEMLPHRYPFLLIDKVVNIDPGKSIVAIKNVSFNEPFFTGHFPENPIMPGVLQIEAMAQAGGIMELYAKQIKTDRKGQDANIFFLAIDKVRFRGPVRPGDCLRIEVEMLQSRRDTIKFSGKCYVENKLVSEAELMAMLSTKNTAA